MSNKMNDEQNIIQKRDYKLKQQDQDDSMIFVHYILILISKCFPNIMPEFWNKGNLVLSCINHPNINRSQSAEYQEETEHASRLSTSYTHYNI